jgi:D-tyrosyl-tRNA(Tyr) deacylase
MRAVIQRVTKCRLDIGGREYCRTGKGMLILLSIEDADNQEDVDWLAAKISKLRIFDDAQGVMNLSVTETGGEVMIVSQFTLHASTKKGNRPSYIRAARPETAIPLYEQFIRQMEAELRKPVSTGVFGENMQIEFTNDGPVTIIIDTKNKE